MGIRIVLWGALAVLIAAARVQAQSEVGTVAAMLGTPQIQRGGSWQNASVGAPVLVGDRLRTGQSDQAKVIFRDDSVVDVAPNTEVSLDTQTFDPGARRFQSLWRLAKGKIRAWVSDYYHEPRARYEVETPTAVAGVRGTEFIAVYDPAAEVTDVVGISEVTEVTGKVVLVGGAVKVGPQLFTQVQKGRFPTAPQRLDAARFQQYLEGLDIIGTGRLEGLSVQHPAVAGRLLAPQDVPGAVARAAQAGPTELTVEGPQDFLADRISADMLTNTQPLLDFRETPPGQSPVIIPPPPGGVIIRY